MNTTLTSENRRTLLELLGEQLGERINETNTKQAETAFGRIHLQLHAVANEIGRGEGRDNERLLDTVIEIAAIAIDYAANSLLPEIQGEEVGR